MSPVEFTVIAEARHGPQWYGPLAEETGYSFSHLWRIGNEGRPVSRKLALAIKNLKPTNNKERTPPMTADTKKKYKHPSRGWMMEPQGIRKDGMPIATGYKVYDWPCPWCGERGYESDSHCSGREVNCASCEKPFETGYAE